MPPVPRLAQPPDPARLAVLDIEIVIINSPDVLHIVGDLRQIPQRFNLDFRHLFLNPADMD